jgi:hypothetical protein
MVESVVFIDTEPSSAERNGQRHQHDPVRRHRQARPPRQVAGMTTQGVASEKQDGDRDGVRRACRRTTWSKTMKGTTTGKVEATTSRNTAAAAAKS